MTIYLCMVIDLLVTYPAHVTIIALYLMHACYVHVCGQLAMNQITIHPAQTHVQMLCVLYNVVYAYV